MADSVFLESAISCPGKVGTLPSCLAWYCHALPCFRSKTTYKEASNTYIAVNFEDPRPRHRTVVVSPGTVGNLAATELATIRPFVNLSISFVSRKPLQIELELGILPKNRKFSGEIILTGGEGCPEVSGFRLRPRPKVRTRAVPTPEAAGRKKSALGAVALLLADLARQEHRQPEMWLHPTPQGTINQRR
jgi:hypothetical protein